MSIRTIIEFNNDRIEDLRRNGHISDDLFALITKSHASTGGMQGVHFVADLHHSNDYCIVFDGVKIPRYPALKRQEQK